MDLVTRWLRRLPPTTRDVLLAGGLAIAGVGLTPTVPVHPGHRPAEALALVLAALAALVLVFRRRLPLVTLGVSAGLMAVYEGRGYEGGPALLAPLVALYSVATVESRIKSLGLGVLVAVALGLTRAIFTSQATAGITTSAIGFIGASLFLGWAVANRRAYVAQIRDRAERAERTREEEARRRVDDERLRIARELHDAVAHSISTINVQAGVAAHVVEKRPEQAGEALAVIRDTSQRVLAELREILGLLRRVDDEQPRAPTAGLEQLDALLETCRRSGVDVELAVEGEPRTLPAAVDIAAYRILQESLTNVMRHAETTSAHVGIGYGPSALSLTVTDDGRGCGTFTNGGGHGIIGMRERVRALGGTLEAGPRAEGGFEVTASLPLQA